MKSPLGPTDSRSAWMTILAPDPTHRACIKTNQLIYMTVGPASSRLYIKFCLKINGGVSTASYSAHGINDFIVCLGYTWNLKEEIMDQLSYVREYQKGLAAG